MKLIVGLGNPGKEYNNTRHNMGFTVIDKYVEKHNLTEQNKFNGLYYQTIINGEKVLFIKPQKYINLSGDVLIEYVNYYKVATDDILIISDDLDMPFGKIKIKKSGSSGGHNGLKNIESQLKTKDYKRIKIGISNDKSIDTKDFVLGKLGKDSLKKLDEIDNIVCNIIDDYFSLSFDNLMNKYNSK